MKLSIATITISKERQLFALLSSLTHIADELVVFVDDTTTDNSLAVARSFTDRAFLARHSDNGTFEARAQEMVSACTGDWILIIADDETLSPQWNRALVSKLMTDRNATHYWVPRCWMLPQNNHFICTSPWYPDYQLRFFRNIPSLLKFPNKIHESMLVAGEGVYLADASIYHWDLVWNSRENREKKVARYKRLNPENPCGEYYLYEDHYCETASVEEISSLPSTDNQVAKINTGLVEIKLLSYPKRMVTGQMYTVNVSMSNFSTRTFRPTSHFIEKTITSIGYHWLVQDHSQIKVQQWENPLIELPIRLSPGETAQCLLLITAPHGQGNYLLVLDIFEHAIGWFSQASLVNGYGYEIQVVSNWHSLYNNPSLLRRMDKLEVSGLEVKLTCALEVEELQLQTGERVNIPVMVHNRSTKPLASLPPHPVHVSYHWLTPQGSVELYDGLRTPFPTPLLPGEERKIRLTVEALKREGVYVLQITMVQEHCFWFENVLKQFSVNIPNVTVTREQKRQTLILCKAALKQGHLAEALSFYKKELELLGNDFTDGQVLACKVTSVKNWCQKNSLPYFKLEEAKPWQVPVPYVLGQKESLPYAGKTTIPEIYLAEVHDAVVIGGHGPVLVNNNTVALFDEYLHPEKKRYDYNLPEFIIREFADKALLLVFETKEGVEIKEGILLCGVASNNYFHWMVEFLPRLWALDQFAEYQHWPLIIDDNLPPNLLQALQLLNRHNRPLLPIQYGIRHLVRKLVIPSKLEFMPINYQTGIKSSYKDIAISPIAISFLRQRFEVEKRISQTSEKKRLYLHRKEGSYRKLVNEEAIEEIFRNYGFEVVDTGKLSFREQMELFASAEFIAGPTGAAMTNIIFAPLTTQIIILTVAETFYIYSNIAHLIGQRMIHLHGKMIKGTHSIEYQSDYMINPQEVKQVLDSVCQNRVAMMN